MFVYIRRENSNYSKFPLNFAAEAETSKKAAGNISHLVKKRKKSGEETANGDSPNKKPHLENGEAEAATANGSTSNGH